MQVNMRKVIFYVMYSLMMANLFFSSSAFPNDLGTIGQTYPIMEIDFLAFIKARAFFMQQNGQLRVLQKDMQARALHYRDRPAPVMGIQHATQTKKWMFDPSIMLDHDVTTPDGNLIARSGTRINPLTSVSLSKTLIFYDADDQDEVRWVTALDQKLKGKDKLIVVNGSVLREEKRFLKPIYFDQVGCLTSHFGITHVPAIITQAGVLLQISEVKPSC